VGIDTSKPNLLERRKDWNGPTDAAFALPTEIWRESIERLQRCDDILGRIERGEITSITDFITYNLDIRQFAHDLLAKATDHKFVLHFYHALQRVTILDPTCGSGAFLFAALNILEPLYEVCIDRMQEFNAENKNLFTAELAEISHKYRSNIQYFIYKSIILRNLYGVDIMVEATEIAKLRLFLKMVAVVDVDRRSPNLGLDPLPDIDFNIRCGNTLVGYATEEELNRDLNSDTDLLQMIANQEFKATIDEEMAKVAAAYEVFKSVQLNQAEDMVTFKHAKHELAMRLKSLNEKLNKKLHLGSVAIPYEEWLKSHQPFHWLAEFYQIIQGHGGFDVIIGNPPYVTFTDTSLCYKVRNYRTYCTKNLFSLCGERFTALIHTNSSIGYIIPLSGMSIDGFEKLQSIMYDKCDSWNSFYSGDRNPSELFTGVKIRAGIYVSRHVNRSGSKFVCRYIKYSAIERQHLFSKINYTLASEFTSAPKIPSKIGLSIISKICNYSKKLNDVFLPEATIVYHAAPIHWCKCLSDLAALQNNDLNIADSYKRLSIANEYRNFAFTLLNSTLFYFYWITFSDCYNLTKKYFNIGIPDKINTTEFDNLAISLNRELIKNIQIAEYQYKNRGIVRFAQFFPKKSKWLIDQIDTALAYNYGFTEEELDFIINYDIKYRMGDELNTEE
jgi:hypothetical protein